MEKSKKKKQSRVHEDSLMEGVGSMIGKILRKVPFEFRVERVGVMDSDSGDDVDVAVWRRSCIVA